MRRVIIESPFAGEIERNIWYARQCVRDSLMKGESPIASHLLYTQPGILDDNIPDERNLGIAAGLAWRKDAEATVVYKDFGISSGMEYGIADAMTNERPVEYRSILEIFNKYNHHGKDVMVRSDLKGRHRDFCLCFECKEFKPEEEDNCPIAKATYKNCVEHGIVTPMWECPKFEDKLDRKVGTENAGD